jgi:outer membrane protein OmpA-like peptidoglycan-associated protein/opacity protein-like surface antigen
MRLRVGLLSILALAVLIAPSSASAAKNMDRGGMYIMPFGGYTYFDDQFGGRTINDATATIDDNYHVGGRLGYRWNNGFGIELDGGWTPTEVTGTGSTADMQFYYGGIGLHYEFPRSNFGAPFLGAGYALGRSSLSNQTPAGSLYYPVSPTEGSNDLDMGFLDVAAGWNYYFTDNFGLRAEGRWLLWLPKDDWTKADIDHWIVGLGLGWYLGGKDTDGDGVKDGKDNCPDTPKGAKVDANGCPLDADGDGVPDGIDMCASTPKGARVDAKGCTTDSDGDGVVDGIDKCADTPKGAKVDATGCVLDADKDGVGDGLDQCPNTPAGAKVDTKGCPTDADGDGVPDGIDACANTPTGVKVDTKGCPERTAAQQQLIDTGKFSTTDVTFDTGKATLKPSSHAILNEIGAVLNAVPAVKMEIGGYTDNTGSLKTNNTLSAARAQAVKDYLTSNFSAIIPANITTRGYGPSNPIAPNTTAAGRAQNRRVEFKVLNLDEVKK